MNTFKIAKKLRHVLLVICALGANSMALAAPVVYQDVGFFSGIGSNSESFRIDSAGVYKATLTDFKFPSAFSSNFGLMVSTSDTTVDSILGAGSFTFDALPGLYWASVFGGTSQPLDLGLYGVRIEQVNQILATPLPAGLMLLASGLVVLFGAGRGGARIPRRFSSSEAMT